MKRAVNAARHRWKQKCQLSPGYPLSWSDRSLANKQRQLEAAKKGGQAIGRQIKEQQRLFWRWYYGDCKAQLRGPFKAVVETFERIEAAYDQRFGSGIAKEIAWQGFEHEVFSKFILRSCSKMEPETIERQMWAAYEKFMEADDRTLCGDNGRGGLLKALFDYEAAKERRENWNEALVALASLSTTSKRRNSS